MINFNSKFNSKAPNIAFFLLNELSFKANKLVSTETVSKINSFLKKVSKNNKKDILTFDLSENQKCFLIIVKLNKYYKIQRHLMMMSQSKNHLYYLIE